MTEQTGYKRAFRIAYRIFNWTALVGLIVMLALILHRPAMPQIDIDPGAAARVEQKLAAVDQAKAQGQPANLQLDSSELNYYLAQNLQLEGAPQTASLAAPANPSNPSVAGAIPGSGASSSDQASIEEVQSSVRDVKIDMTGDMITAYVIFDLHGKDLSLELAGHVAAEDGYMKFEPVAGKFGSLPLSHSTLNAAVDRLMNSAENREKFRLPDDVSDIHIEEGQVVVSYK